MLLRRWEHALEDVSLWRFNPCVVHGDLHEDNLLVDGDRVTAVTGWTDLRIGDPADDMAWLVASNDQDFVDVVLAPYTASRRDVPDPHLLRRAALSAEFALAQYLVKGLAAGNQDMIDEAESMLTALAEDVAEHGGQPISVEPLPQPAPAPDAAGQPPQNAAAADAPVPAVSKVTLLAPDPVSGPAAVPSSTAMPAVHVTPIPLAADGEDTEQFRLMEPFRLTERLGLTALPGMAARLTTGVPPAPCRSPPGCPVSPSPRFPTTGRPLQGPPARTPRPSRSPSSRPYSCRGTCSGRGRHAGPGRRRGSAGSPANPADDTSTTALTVVEAKSR